MPRIEIHSEDEGQEAQDFKFVSLVHPGGTTIELGVEPSDQRDAGAIDITEEQYAALIVQINEMIAGQAHRRAAGGESASSSSWLLDSLRRAGVTHDRPWVPAWSGHQVFAARHPKPFKDIELDPETSLAALAI